MRRATQPARNAATPMRLRRIACALGAAAASSAAQAQPVTTLPTTVVTAARVPTAIERLPAATTVITRAEIAARRPASALELLRQIPGLHLDLPGGRGGVSSVYVRGGDPNHTLVLIDGVKVNDPTNARGGSYDFSLLAPESIERIEIVRGPMSALYGSDALAGVVNIITRKGSAEPEATAEAMLGRFDSHAASASVSGPLGRGRVAFGASYADGGEPVAGDSFVSRSATAGFSLPPSASTLIEGSLRLVDADREGFPEDSGGPQFAVRRAVDEREDRQLAAGLHFTHAFREDWSYELRAGYFDQDSAFRSPGVAPGVRDPIGIPPNFADSDFRRYEVAAQAQGRLMPALRVTFGAQAEREEGKTRGGLQLGPFVAPTSFELERRILAPYVEAQYAPTQAFLLQASLRWDFPEDFDSEASPRLGASYSFAGTGATLRGSWGRGFKLPSFFALGHPIVGNPALSPEKNESFELGLNHTVGNGAASFDVALFDARYEDAVDFEEGPPPRLVNRSEVRARGVELSAAWRATAALTLDANVTYTDADIRGTTEKLRNRPKWRGGTRALWRASSDLSLSLSALYVGETPDSSIPTGDVTLDPYFRLDASADWRLAPGWSVFLAVDNLLNAEYEEFVGFADRGVRPRVGSRVRF